ncbi:hypothetical protein, partial [Actinoplanes philippinensis]|uniref:hypothetical protein n=1 Tax=Actinoplanes philippinensis TaxID=35752 RepID=UPI0033CFC656
MPGPRWRAWQAVIGVSAALAVPAVVLPGTATATVAYLAALAVIAAGLIAAARSLPVDQRRIWMPWIAGVGCAVTGSAVWQVRTDVALVCWLAFYLPITVAVVRMIEARALPRPVRHAIAKDVGVVTVAMTVFAWYVLIQPSLAKSAGGGGWGTVAAFCFPLGDVVIVGLALTVLLAPGRRTASEHLIVTGLTLSLLADLGNALLPPAARTDIWYMPTYLLVNGMLTAAVLHRSRAAPTAPTGPAVRATIAPGMRGWRMALLG